MASNYPHRAIRAHDSFCRLARTVSLFRQTHPSRMLGPLMDTNPSPAEELPALYHAILDGVADLERRGHRREAAAARSAATAAYSRSWDDRGRRQLVAIQRRIERVVAAEAGSPGAGGEPSIRVERSAPAR